MRVLIVETGGFPVGCYPPGAGCGRRLVDIRIRTVDNECTTEKEMKIMRRWLAAAGIIAAFWALEGAERSMASGHRLPLPPPGITVTFHGTGLGPYTREILESAEAADRYFGRIPCGGHVTIGPGTFTGPSGVAEGYNEGVVAAARWTGNYESCEVALTPHYLGFGPGPRHPFLMCITMAHEFGHFFGYEDTSTDPRSVNYPVVNESVRDPVCERRWRHRGGELTPE